jgi:putative intracellular protease/amidase
MKKKVLMVLTSHGTLGTTGGKTGVWIEEFANPYYTFIDHGIALTLASLTGGQPPIDPRSTHPEMQTEATKRFHKDPVAQKAFGNTIPISKVKAVDYDSIFFPGGHGPMWDLAAAQTNAKLLSEFYDAGKPIGAVCHGPAALTKAIDKNGASIVKGKRVTGFTNTEEKAVGLDKVVPFLLEEKLRELGGLYSNGADWTSYVVTDGILVTGQNPASAGETAKALIDILSNKK